MPQQWMGARATYTWFIASHPAMAPRLKTPAERLDSAAPSSALINDFGAHKCCPHYAGTFTPMHNVVLQRKMLGYKDWETEPKLPRFAEWYLNLMTPADVRFGGLRCLIVDGDGEPCDPSPLLGEMATACAESHPALSARLMWMWQANGRRHSGFYSSTHLRINEDLPPEDPRLGNVTYPGYGVFLRSGWNTPRETSVHAFNGGWYTDHRVTSSLAIYALGAPLALNWETMYNPKLFAQYLWPGIVIPESKLGMPWNADLPALDATSGAGVGPWSTEAQNQFADFSESGLAVYDAASADKNPDLTWTRSVAQIYPEADYPLIVIRDAFSGARARESMTLTLALMAEGPVETCAGTVTPKEAFWDINDKSKQNPPSGGTAHPMPAGLNTFAFKGQQFGKTGETPAIDFDLYSLAKDAREFCIGSWGHNNAGPAREPFQQANGRPYEQRQHLLHLKGAGGFATLIVPRRKGAKAPAVTQDGETFKVAMQGGTGRLSADGYTYVGADKAVATAFGDAAVMAEGLSVEGGPTEVAYDRKFRTITVTAHGPGGQRLIGVPAGRWEAQDKALAWDAAAKKWTLDYAGGKPGEAKPATAVLKQAKP
jgi:hypothetical protein